VRIGPTLLVATFLLPTIAAQPLLLGTEELPELPASGPPQYATTYTGPKDHDYLQILAGWFAFDDAADEITWTLKVPDGKAYASPPEDYLLRCLVEANITRGEERVGFLSIDWVHNGDRADSRVTFSRAQGVSGGPTQYTSEDVAHRFDARLGSPAYLEYRILRPDLLAFGDEIRDFVGHCEEFYYPLEYAALAADATTNSAASKSDAVYSFTELRRVRGPDGNLDPIEEFERTATPEANPTTETSGAEQRTPAFVAMIAATALAVAAVILRTRRP
jgi:hypothetical protein